jgi:hypothetical protein
MSRRVPGQGPRGGSKYERYVSKDRMFAAYDGMSHEEAGKASFQFFRVET